MVGVVVGVLRDKGKVIKQLKIYERNNGEDMFRGRYGEGNGLEIMTTTSKEVGAT